MFRHWIADFLLESCVRNCAQYPEQLDAPNTGVLPDSKPSRQDECLPSEFHYPTASSEVSALDNLPHAVLLFKNSATTDICLSDQHPPLPRTHHIKKALTYLSGTSRLEQWEAPENVYHLTCLIFSKYGYTHESLPSSNSPLSTRQGTLILWSSSMTLQVFRLPITVNSEGPDTCQ
jgi:hypothetical protein